MIIFNRSYLLANEHYLTRTINSPNCNTTKGGSVTCEVCGLTKFYSHISRRYGVFSCESCAKFFYRYSQKPVPYNCTGNNKCPLNIDLPGARCKSCLLDACLKKYILDPKKHHKILAKDINVDGEQISEPVKQESYLNKVPNLSGETLPSKCSNSPDSSNVDEKTFSSNELEKGIKFTKSQVLPQVTNSKKRKLEESIDCVKIRKVACKQCAGCLAEDCGKCLYCLDKPKFGGNDVKKQKCLRRQCHIQQ